MYYFKVRILCVYFYFINNDYENHKIEKIGKYDIIGELGQGSFGKVYLATSNGEQLALKCIPKKMRKPNQIRTLKAETDLLSKLNHQNIISMKQCFQTNEQVVVVMEYAGQDLSRLIEKEIRLSQERVKNIAKQVLSAMLYLHQNRILHRDLKPQNILFKGDQIKLCDFGFAKKMSASVSFLRSIKGTPLYIAPQILLGQAYTHKVDVWSLGIILFELASGRPPFHAKNLQSLQPKILHDPIKFPQSMSTNLRDLIDGMLQKSQNKRFDWNQVKNHPFFINTVPLPKQVPLEQKMVERQKIEVAKPVVWIAQQQCAYLKKIQSDMEEGKVSLIELRYNEQFCIRATQFIGQACIDRTKTPRDILLILLQRIVTISRFKDTKEQKDNEDKDLTKNKQIMTAIVTLAIDQVDDQLLTTQLQLIGYLLQQNFDKVKIDTDHDDQITTLIAAKLLAKVCPKSVNNCFKVLGILTSQALVTLSQSQQYFQRLSEEKILSIVAEYYTTAPQNTIVLQVISKFIHPKFERNSSLNYRLKALFRGFKVQVAPILLKNGLISEQSPISRTWKNPNHDLQVYCSIVYNMICVSQQARVEFMKHNYWKDLLTNPKTKIFFLAMIQAILKYSGVFQLSIDIIQNQIVIQPTGNKLFSIFLIYFTPQHFTQQLSKNNNVSKKIEKLKITINKIEELIKIDQSLKIKWCKEFLGFFNQDSQFYDDLLIQTLHQLVKDSKEEEVINLSRTVAQDSLLLPLSEESLNRCLQIIQKQTKPLGSSQVKKLDDYFIEMVKNQGFDDYLNVNPTECSKLLTKILKIQTVRLDEQYLQEIYLELSQRSQLLRLLINEQILNQQLLLPTLRIINKIITKLKSIDFLGQGAFQLIKKYFKTTNEQLKIQIIIYCSHLARVKTQYCRDQLDNGIISICYRALKQDNQLLIQKTLHLIGNLSKHNSEAFQQFQKYQIVCCIHKCITQYHKNKRILKNTIYAIGNISFYGEQFAFHIKQTIKYFIEGLSNDDNHLLLNTISTISNLLRHSSKHLQSLMDFGIFSKLIEIYGSTTNPDHVSYINNVLRKAVNYPQFNKVYSKQSIRKLLQSNVRRGVLKQGDNNVRNLKMLLCA